MKITTVGVGITPTDRPHISVPTDDPTCLIAIVHLDVAGAYVHSESPAALERLARSFDEAAVRLSAALDAKAASAINAQRVA